MIQVQGTGIVQTKLSDFPVLAVTVLDRLGYRISRASKQLDQIVASERVDERIGRDVWRHDYRVVMRWDLEGDGIFVTVDLEERVGSASTFECQERCDAIFAELHKDAKRAERTASHKEKSTAYGAAKWGTEDELLKKGYFLDAVDPKRLIIGKTTEGKYIQVPEYWSHAHALICGRTGVGKSRGFFIPQLIERIATSMVVTEATPGYETGELYHLTSGWRKMAGHQIYSFNPADMTSNRINPIDSVRWAPPDEKASRAEKLADLVIMNGESSEVKNEQTWNRSEKLLLIPLILHAAAGEPELGHFGALRWQLLQGPDYVGKILKRSPSDVAQLEFEGWRSLSGETNFKYGVFSGLITKLNPWLTDQMVALTEKTDIDLNELKQKLFTFYLAVPNRSRDSKLIGSLMVNFLLDHILEIRQEMKYPVTMLLDEFTNFGKISGISETLSIIRKNKIGLILGFQNYFQLEQVYSRREAQIIMDQPATQIYFKQKNFRESKELSDAIGRTTIEEVTVSDAGRVHELVQGRQLITPDELISLNKEVIVFTADTKPLKLALTEPTAYEHALTYDPPCRVKHDVSEFVRRRGRTTAAQDAESQESVEHGKQAKQGPQPDTKAEQPERSKEGASLESKVTETAANEEETKRPSEHPAPERDRGGSPDDGGRSPAERTGRDAPESYD
ncbi:MAG: type IV secretory system conjugative DNA transfer family protein [Cyanobacteria bacterium SZAS LIN-3]|nr:type IV secretory system conjugative DNA transfer family protein [Cyanobacteria bacterium SZAS LIN-3]